MDIKRLKELEDRIAVRKPLEVSYENKKSLFKIGELDNLQSSIEQRLVSESFVITPIEEGIKGTYIELTVSVQKNLLDTQQDKGLSVFMEIKFEGPVTRNFRVSSYELGNTGVVPDPIPQIEGQDDISYEIQREQQLIDYYQNFNDSDLNPTLGYSLTDKDANINSRFASLDELLNSLFVLA